MRRLLMLLGSGAITFAAGQPVTRMWVKTTSLPQSDSYSDMVQDSFGNTFVCGTATLANRYTMLLVKYDRNGNKIWERTYPSATGHSVAQAVAVDPSGNVVIVGNTMWQPPADGWSRIIKVSAGGQFLWERTDPDTIIGSYFYDVAVDNMGEITTTGYQNNVGDKLICTTHFLSSGTLAWSRSYGYPGLASGADQAGRYVKVDASRNIYVCGVNNGFPGNTYNTVVKYSRTSSQLWMRHMVNGIRDYPRGFAQLPGGRFAMTCETTNNVSLQFGTTTVYDQNGTELSRRTVANSSTFSIRGFDADRDGGLFVAAQTSNGGSNIQSLIESLPPVGDPMTLIGFTQPDLRTACAGVRGGDMYAGSIPGGTGARPATIQGFHIPSTFISSNTMWSAMIYGSTLGGQTPYAITKGMMTDAKGDLFVIGDASGVGGTDAFFVKYETGPVANNDSYTLPGNQLFTASEGVLTNDFQYSQATLTVDGQPSHGTLTMNADGTFSYLPDTGFVGTDGFSYSLIRTNSSVPRSSATSVQLKVNAP